jgi:maltodextrin utilization protein YvdJ
VKEGAFADFVHCQKNAAGQNVVTPVMKHDYLIDKQMEAYSLYEKEVIDSVIDAYRDKSADELSEITHEVDSLWSRIVNEQNVVFVDGKSDVEIPLARLNDGDEDKAAIYEEALDYMQFCNATLSC